MLFQVIYLLCVILWLAVPTLRGHELLLAIFPNFELLTIGSFIYGLVASMIYGWIAAVIFVFFYNLWPSLVALFLGRRGKKARDAVATAMLLAVALTTMPSSISSAYAQSAPNTSTSLPQSTVKALQDALNKQGIAVKADGVFTQETREAVRKFQSQHHLPVTGEADNATLAKLGVVSGTSAAQPTTGQAAQSPAGSPQPPSDPGQGAMMSGPMMQGMMQGMMKTMQGMMGMMNAQPEQTQPGQTQREDSRQSPPQGVMRANCQMMSGESGPAMMQMMQGMMQMMQMMQGQMQSTPRQ
jgi:hypothetical protein